MPRDLWVLLPQLCVCVPPSIRPCPPHPPTHPPTRPPTHRSNLPLAKKPAPLSALDLAAWQSYVKSIIPHVAGPAVALVTALVLLLSFVVWRLVRCCACCATRHGGKKARKVLAGGGAPRLKAAVLLLAAGVLAGTIYGIVQVGGC